MRGKKVAIMRNKVAITVWENHNCEIKKKKILGMKSQLWCIKLQLWEIDDKM